MPQTATCPITHQLFPIHAEDEVFYEKMGVPLPTLCPSERMRRRMAWRNELSLYSRTCDATGKPIISIFDPNGPFQVYSQEHWWSDSWDPTSFGRDFDFSRPFFDQFKELQAEVPRICLLSKTSQNSEYTNHAANNKDCYMSSIVFNSEHVLFSREIFKSEFVLDSNIIEKGQWLYECFFGDNLYQCLHCQICFNSSDLAFCIDCRGCQNCFMSSNLRNQQYVFYNQKLTQSEYEARMAEINTGDAKKFESLLQEYKTLRTEYTIYPHRRLHQCENISGDFLNHCKDCYQCFYSTNAEKVRYSENFDASDGTGNENCMDGYGFGGCQWIYEIQGQSNGYHNIACSWSYDIQEGSYLDMCHNSQNCFGCVGIKKGKYCLFNKSYTKHEYETLNKKIIQHMRETKEWGEFFPITLSPFAYNETMAQIHMPLTKEEAIKRGYRWRDETVETPPQLPSTNYQLPTNITDTPDAILSQTLHCAETHKPYKIAKAELTFYRKMNLPLPRLHPSVRNLHRMALRNAPLFYDRTCPECQKAMQTTYSAAQPEKILCEECYLKTVN